MMSDKKLEKLQKALGKETVEELQALSIPDLKQRVVDANSAMKQVEEELEANPKYQELKENLKALREGKKEVNKRQRAIIKYSLHELDVRGN